MKVARASVCRDDNVSIRDRKNRSDGQIGTKDALEMLANTDIPYIVYSCQVIKRGVTCISPPPARLGLAVKHRSLIPDADLCQR